VILEIAVFSVLPGKAADFEAAYAKAYRVIRRAPGCGTVSLQRSIETPGRYVLLVEWPSVAHHMEGFRSSPLFQEWRALLGPYFASTPAVEHHDPVAASSSP
jgi:quinol monooxygenase YgiN